MPTNDDTPTIEEILDKLVTFVMNTDEQPIATLDEAKAAIQNLIDRARLDENERTLYWLEDTQLPAETIIKGLTKDRQARRKQLEAKIKEGE